MSAIASGDPFDAMIKLSFSGDFHTRDIASRLCRQRILLYQRPIVMEMFSCREGFAAELAQGLFHGIKRVCLACQYAEFDYFVEIFM